MARVLSFILIILIFVFGASILFSHRNGEKPSSASVEGISFSEETPQDVPQESNNLNLEREKKMSYTVTLKTTEGDIAIKLSDNETPIAVNNFVKLSKDGFYAGVIFHRVIDGFMIQGGDPKGNGTGGPGYTFDDEPFTGEYVRGTVAMANSGPNTNGSQFFIMHQDYPLPKNYTIFGQVVEGLDVVDRIATAEIVPGPSGENSTPVNPIVIESAEVLEEESE